MSRSVPPRVDSPCELAKRPTGSGSSSPTQSIRARRRPLRGPATRARACGSLPDGRAAVGKAKGSGLPRGCSWARPDPAEVGDEAARGRADRDRLVFVRLGIQAQERGDRTDRRPTRRRPPRRPPRWGLPRSGRSPGSTRSAGSMRHSSCARVADEPPGVMVDRDRGGHRREHLLHGRAARARTRCAGRASSPRRGLRARRHPRRPRSTTRLRRPPRAVRICPLPGRSA